MIVTHMVTQGHSGNAFSRCLFVLDISGKEAEIQEQRRKVVVLSHQLSGKWRQKDRLGGLPSQSSVPWPSSCLGLGAVGVGGPGDRGRPENGRPPPAFTPHVLVPNFPSSLL